MIKINIVIPIMIAPRFTHSSMLLPYRENSEILENGSVVGSWVNTDAISRTSLS